MTIKKAIEHFEFKLSKVWKPTELDLDAYNTLVEFTEDKLKQQYNDNQLLGKLYITFLGELIKFYDTTYDDKTPQIALHKILDTPMELIIQKFIDKCNLQEQTKEHRKKNGIKHPKLVDTSDIDPFAEALTYDEAVENLTTMINMALTKYK